MTSQVVDFLFNDVHQRKHYIGGSDIAKVMGLSRWGTPLSLWAEKTGKIPAKDLSNVEAVQIGTDLEQFVADMFTKRTGKTVRKAPKTYQHPDYPYMVAHIDRLVTGSDELLECKTCSFFKGDEWVEDEIPQEYILQVMWYLGITGRKTGHIAVLIGGQKFVTKPIEFDQELFDQMVESAKNFWMCVINDTPPAVMSADDETLASLYHDHSEEFIELEPIDDKSAEAVDDLENAIARLQAVKGEIKDLEDEKKTIETSLKDLIKEHLGILTPQYRVTWKQQTVPRLDTTRFKLERPDTYQDYLVQNTFRVLRVAKNK